MNNETSTCMLVQHGAGKLPSRIYNDEVAATKRDRLEHFRWHISATADLDEDEASADADFAARARTWLLGNAVFMSTDFPLLTLHRQGKYLRSGQLDQYAVQINTGAGFQIEADGRRVTTDSMEAVLTDLTRPETLTMGAGRSITMLLPREELDRLLPRAFDLHGVVLRGCAANLLTQHLLGLEAQMPSMLQPESEGVKQATLYLLAASLAPSVASLGLARAPVEQSLLRQLRHYVEEHLPDSALSAESLCAEVKISRSTLFRLFQPYGGVNAYIRERRLERVHALLTSGEAEVAGHRYLGRIADDFGFSNASLFSRAFRDQFGYSPRDARTMAPQRPTAAARGKVSALFKDRFGDWSTLSSLHDSGVGSSATR
jgi:AraC-like DNA-binding protein